MSNIADLIEDYILRRLAAEHNRKVELKRSDIAEAISCAPSQISYVLSTRFTQDKGFVVESRRGLGGFIRIGRVPLQNYVYQEVIDKLHEENSMQDIEVMIRYMLKHQVIQKREAALILQSAATAFEVMDPATRVEFLKSLVITLANFG